VPRKKRHVSAWGRKAPKGEKTVSKLSLIRVKKEGKKEIEKKRREQLTDFRVGEKGKKLREMEYKGGKIGTRGEIWERLKKLGCGEGRRKQVHVMY